MERVAEGVREALAEIIQDSVKDPGMPTVFTITHVEVSRDLHHARVHFSQLPDDEGAVAATQAALERARGFLRRELGLRVPLKYLPELSFFFDASPRHAQRIAQLLHQIDSSKTPDPAQTVSAAEESSEKR
jgi:ribosome-binding factor A